MESSSPGIIKRWWAALNKPSKYSFLAVVVISMLTGVIFWLGFNKALEHSETTEFCVGCHEMEVNFTEYKETIHYSNRSGVRASCPDCHEAKDFIHKMIRKGEASLEMYASLTGKIDTPEKFEKHRMEMATIEWNRMKRRDSQECRNCHNFEAMSEEKQKKSNFTRHMKAKELGKTCINCHKGIAHKLPAEYDEDNDPDAGL